MPSPWLLQQVRVLVARSALILVKSADDLLGLRPIQNISCNRVCARAALLLMRSPSARAFECTFLRGGRFVSGWNVVRVYGCMCALSGICVVACKVGILVLRPAKHAQDPPFD